MNQENRFVLIAALATGLLLATPFAIGAALPRTHTVKVSKTLDIAAPKLFAFAVNIDRWPLWRSDVDSVTHLQGEGFRAAISSGGDTIIYEFDVNFSGLSMISTIVTEGIPYGGSWEIQVEPSGTHNSQITVTERGFVGPPLWRFISRFVIGHKKSAQRYLNELEAACSREECVGRRVEGFSNVQITIADINYIQDGSPTTY